MLARNRKASRFLTKASLNLAFLDQFASTTSATQYSDDKAARYAKLKKDMHYVYDGLQTNILSQLKKYHKNLNLSSSEMNVIDIACGDGNYSRCLADNFEYNEILGVDISESQIELARNVTDTTKYPNIRYQCLDANSLISDPSMNNKFDIALAVWFYNYASDKQSLFNYIKSTYNVMKSNSILIGITHSIHDINKKSIGIYADDPEFKMSNPIDSVKMEGLWTEVLGSGRGLFEFQFYVYETATYQSLFNKAGFSQFRFLDGNEYVTGNNSTEEEQQLFQRYICYEGCSTQTFIARK